MVIILEATLRLVVPYQPHLLGWGVWGVDLPPLLARCFPSLGAKLPTIQVSTVGAKTGFTLDNAHGTPTA